MNLVGGQMTLFLPPSIPSPGSHAKSHPSLQVGPASCAHPFPKGDEGSPGQPQCSHPLPGLHQIQGEVRPRQPAQTSGGHPSLPRLGIRETLALTDHQTKKAFLFLCLWAQGCSSLVKLPSSSSCELYGTRKSLNLCASTSSSLKPV